MREKTMRFFGVLLALWLAVEGSGANAATVTDAAGRAVTLPAKIDRVMAAGPPASVLLYVLAPEKMVNWAIEPSIAEKAYLLPSVQGLPSYGQLTGKGGANIEAILAAKPDLIIDVGMVNPTYASIADKVQQQTGIPYLLLDGTFANCAKSLRETGAILGVPDRAEQLAAYADRSLADLRTGLAGLTEAARPKVYYGRGPEGLETGLSGSINMEILEMVGVVTPSPFRFVQAIDMETLERVGAGGGISPPRRERGC